MNTIYTNVRIPLLISLASVSPLLFLEIINQQSSESFPFFLFSFLGLTMFLIVLVIRPVLKRIHTGTLNFTPINLVARFLLFAGLTYVWISLLIDQMPCFLGGVNCD